MTIKLSNEEKEYYKRENSWIGVPFLELNLLFSEGLDGSEIYQFINNQLDHVHWEGMAVEGKLIYHIIKLDSSTLFGICHYFHCEPDYSFYKLDIPPVELKRVLGAIPNTPEEVKHVNAVKFKAILNMLIALARKLHQNFPLTYATIVDETGDVVRRDSMLKSGIYIDSMYDLCIQEEVPETKYLGYFRYLPWSP